MPNEAQNLQESQEFQEPQEPQEPEKHEESCPGNETVESDEVKKLKADIEKLRAENAGLVSLVKQKELKEAEARERKEHCTCSKKDLIRHKRRPNYKTANYYFEQAQEKSIEANKEKKRQKKRVTNLIEKMISNGIGWNESFATKMPGEAFEGWKKEMAQELAADFLKNKNLNIHDIDEIFRDKEKELQHQGLKEFSADQILDQSEDLDELAHLLKAKRPIEPYLDRLIHYVNDTRLMKLTQIWREKYGSYSDEEKLKERKSFEVSAQKANLWSARFFKEYNLHPMVEATNRLEDLTPEECEKLGISPASKEQLGLESLLSKTIPTDEESFRILVSSMAKIHLMHLAESIRSQIDFNEMGVASEHLRNVLNQFVKRRPDGKWIFEGFDDENPVVVELIEVPNSKSEEAIARKYMDKDPDLTRDFDHSEIQDLVRARVMLTEDISKNPERRNKVAEKIVSYLCSIFGTDASKSRLRYAFETGETNGNSTGKHEAVHVTFRYRYQCTSNGENNSETTKIRTIPVEWQIQSYMTLRENEEDHKDYEEKKNKKITRMTGMDVTFKDFIEDLCDAILSNSLKDKTEITRRKFEHPIQEKMARILFQIITKVDHHGIQINRHIIDEMLKDERQKDKLQKVIDKFKNQEAAHITYVRENIKKAKKEPHYTGWRKRVQNKIKKDNSETIISSLNLEAAKAQEMLSNIERFQSSAPGEGVDLGEEDETF